LSIVVSTLRTRGFDLEDCVRHAWVAALEGAAARMASSRCCLASGLRALRKSEASSS